MGRVFAVRPKRVKRTNGQVLTPDMEITVTTQQYISGINKKRVNH